MRELYAGVSQRFSFGKLAKSFKRHSQKLRAVVAAMAMMVMSCGLWAQTTYTYSKVTAEPADWSGDYIIVAGDKAFNGVIESNWGKFVAVEDSEGIIEMDEDISVTVAQSEVDDSKYTIYLNATSVYLAEVTGNAIAVADEASEDTEWEFSLDDNGLVAVACASNNDRHMRCNGTNGFRCYASTTGTKPFLYKKLPAESSTLSVIADLSEFSYNIGNGPSTAQSFAVSGSNLTADITVSVPDDADFELCATEEGTYSASLTFSPSEGSLASTTVYVRMKAGLDAGMYSGQITVATTGVNSKTISLFGSVIDPDAVYYAKVTEAPEGDDWTGEYLITNINGNVVNALSGSSGTSTNYGTVLNVTEYVIGNKIIANATTDGIKVTARATEGGYSLYLENVGYLGWSSGNSLVFDEEVTTGRNEWTISISEGVVSVSNVGTSERRLQYNNANSRFACYTTNQSAITLYKSPREVAEIIANPVFTPAEGTYPYSVDVTIACETEGATIYYTLDGTDPSDASTAYTEAIHITETKTVKAIAIKNALSSEIVSATYTISNIETVATPVITPEAGSYNTPQQITIVCETAEAVIHYTTDGTDPTAESTSYTEPFTLSASATVKAIAVKEGMNNSQIASAAYTMPVFLENLAAVYSTANNDQYKITGDVVFVFRDHRYMFVKDATAGMMIFDNNDSIITTEYNEGDVISGGIMGKTSIFRGLYEVVPTANLAVSTENNGPVEPIVVTIPQMSNENDFMSQLVTVQNLTVTGIDGQNIIVSDGENTMKIFDRFNLITESDYTVDDVITSVTGLVSKYNSDYQIFPRTADDIVKREVPAEPTFTPEAGTYTASVNVTLACETEGATIYYTLNDTDTEVEYTAPLTFTETTTIYAFAEKNSVRSQTVSAIYTITDMEIVATPTIAPNGGTFEGTQEVTLACETADASIYYTLDGDDPTAASTLYENPFTLNATTTVKAIAMKENMQNSAIAEATFTKTEPVVAVDYTRITSLDQLQDGDKVIIAARYDEDATHYYVAPTRIANSRFNAVAVTAENDVISTDVDSVVWTLSIDGDNYRFVNANDASLGWSSSTNFSSTSNYDWSIEEYTANGLVSNYAGYKITNVASLGESNIRCIAFRNYTTNNGTFNVFGAYADGNASSEEYNFALDIFVDASEHTPIVARPTITPNGGEFETTVEVTLACATEDATIYYTLNGETPTTESTLYVEPFTLSETTTVKAIAVKEGMDNSAVAEATFTKVVPTAATPTITPNGGTFETSVEVTLACATEEAAIYYTLDGTDPTAESTLYAEAFTLDETTTVKAIAIKEGLANSAVAEATFTKVEPPVVVNYTRITSLDQLQDGAKVIIASRYDDDETHYYVAPTRITGKLNGVAVTVDNSIISTDVDTIVWTVSIEGDNYRFVNAADANLGYGSQTNFSSSQNPDWNVAEFTAQGLVDNYSGYKITNVSTLNESSVRAVAFKSGTNVFGAYATSNANADEYNFALDLFVDLGDNVPTVATPVFTPAAGYYETAQNVTITCATEGATIYYTTDGTTPTNASTQYTAPIAVSQNTTIKAIAYVGEEFSFVATARYTFPNFVENIAALYEIENTAETYVLSGDVTFVFRNGKNIYVKDATGGLLIFDQSNVVTTEYTEGDVISGGITGTISMYHGMLEFVPSFNTAASTQNTGAVAPTVITVEQLLSNDYVSQLVKVENVFIAEGTTYTEGQNGSNLTFSQNGNEAILRNGFKTLDMEIGDNTNWDIIGFAAIYDENIQIYPRGNDDVTIVTSVEELASEIAIYPNPTSDIVNIVTNGNAQRVEIANVDGQIVSSEAVASDVVTISLEAQPAGMYFVRIYTANEVIVRKVTKF